MDQVPRGMHPKYRRTMRFCMSFGPLCLRTVVQNGGLAIARHIGVIDNKETVKGLQIPDKNLEHSMVERLRLVQEQYTRVGFGRRITLLSWDGAKMMQQKNSEALGKKNEGNNILILQSAERLLHETADVEDQKRQVRLLMASPPDNAEATTDSKENDIGEDIVVMDYAQPHRKPPIHNREP
ncbi:hypothetical protein ACH5RR_040203 [Cinchona calisaya]|uniref:Uncharacterized protein n=1 Tax=Cinchona calisaya TaxID=153742 RepID=A0ABD2XT53_9GENT